MQGPTIAEADALIQAAKEDLDPRAWFIVSCLRYEGFRAHEIRQMNFEDIDLEARTVMLVRKKRDEASKYPLSKFTMEGLRHWLAHRDEKPGALLYGGPQGTDAQLRVGETRIYKMVQRIGEGIGVDTAPHKIRHRACTDIVQTGVRQQLPEEDLLFLTGHSSRGALAPYYDASKSRKSARSVLDSLDQVVDEDSEE
jgi:integrase